MTSALVVDNVFVPSCSDNVAPTIESTTIKSSSCSNVEIAAPCRQLRPRRESAKFDEREVVKKIRSVVDQPTFSGDDLAFLEQHDSLVKLVKRRRSSYSKHKERSKEFEDEPEILKQSCIRLAEAIRSSKHTIMYTGAGISTSANIPDYRGPDGVWTKLQNGQTVTVDQSLVSATPTYTHMAIEKLLQVGALKYIVSQNCDGLHIRSGVSPDNISEIHGNMFTEICSECHKRFYRIFDVTEHTGLRRHMTSRCCDVCGGKLKDTIVHFGERGDKRWPHCWESACSHVNDADVIICLGSSLKVLRSYKQLWLTDRPKKCRPKLYIVNMQWTPKDSQAVLKINGRADDVMQRVMTQLGLTVTSYESDSDALLRLAIPIASSESETFRTGIIRVPPTHAHLLAHVTPDAAMRVDPNCPFSRKIGPDDDDESTRADLSRDTAVVSTQPDMPGWFGKGRKRVLVRKNSKRKRKKVLE
uniref:NAD-dependent protein deacetylase sirtuin-7 n=1 Tax=Phallusia mammillata TaxID=59560 RepID=A0A6F9DSV1_9ASCI|nr:NAD-dependent protein deacetylase sirtuin-7 [Phallusia mammillata]